MLFEIVQGSVADVQGVDLYLAILEKLEAGQTTVGGDILILLANGLLQSLDFDLAGFLSHHLRVHIFALQSVYGAQEADCECATRSKSEEHTSELQSLRHLV